MEYGRNPKKSNNFVSITPIKEEEWKRERREKEAGRCGDEMPFVLSLFLLLFWLGLLCVCVYICGNMDGPEF